MHTFHRHLSQYIPLNEETFANVLSFFHQRRFRRRQYVAQEGMSNTTSYFLLEGLTRIYEVDERGGEHVLQFKRGGEWIEPAEISMDLQQSPFNMDCIEDSILLLLSADARTALCREVPAMSLYIQQQQQQTMLKMIRRMRSNLLLPVSEQYHHFIEQHPEVNQAVPDHQIASYLGITPQSLSRLRGKERGKRERGLNSFSPLPLFSS